MAQAEVGPKVPRSICCRIFFVSISALVRFHPYLLVPNVTFSRRPYARTRAPAGGRRKAIVRIQCSWIGEIGAIASLGPSVRRRTRWLQGCEGWIRAPAYEGMPSLAAA